MGPDNLTLSFNLASNNLSFRTYLPQYIVYSNKTLDCYLDFRSQLPLSLIWAKSRMLTSIPIMSHDIPPIMVKVF